MCGGSGLERIDPSGEAEVAAGDPTGLGRGEDDIDVGEFPGDCGVVPRGLSSSGDHDHEAERSEVGREDEAAGNAGVIFEDPAIKRFQRVADSGIGQDLFYIEPRFNAALPVRSVAGA